MAVTVSLFLLKKGQPILAQGAWQTLENPFGHKRLARLALAGHHLLRLFESALPFDLETTPHVYEL